MRNRAGRPRVTSRAAARAAGPIHPPWVVAQATPAGRARTKSQLGRQVAPAYPGLEHEQDAVQCHPIRSRPAAWIFLASPLWRRQQRFNQCLQFALNDRRAPKAPSSDGPHQLYAVDLSDTEVVKDAKITSTMQFLFRRVYTRLLGRQDFRGSSVGEARWYQSGLT